jgi:hypothetical protein
MAEWCVALLAGLKELKLNISSVHVQWSDNTLTDSFKIFHLGLNIIMRVRTRNHEFGTFEILENVKAIHSSYQFHCALKNFSLIFYEIDGHCRRRKGEKETATGLRARKLLGDFFKDGLYQFMEIAQCVGSGNESTDYSYFFSDVLLYDVRFRITVTDKGVGVGENNLEFKVTCYGQDEGLRTSFTFEEPFDFTSLVKQIRHYIRKQTHFAPWQCDVLDAFMDTGNIRYKTQTHFETTLEVFSILLQGHGQTAFFQMRFNNERNDTNYYILMDMFGTEESTIHKTFSSKFPDMKQLVGDVDLFLLTHPVLKLPSQHEHRMSLLQAIDKVLSLMQKTDEKSDDYSTLRELLTEIVKHLQTK